MFLQTFDFVHRDIGFPPLLRRGRAVQIGVDPRWKLGVPSGSFSPFQSLFNAMDCIYMNRLKGIIGVHGRFFGGLIRSLALRVVLNTMTTAIRFFVTAYLADLSKA